MNYTNNNKIQKKFNANFKFLFIIATIIILFLIAWGSITLLKNENSCGDGICGNNESIDMCPQDCKTIQKDAIEEEFILCKKDAEKACSAIIAKDISSCNSINSEIIKDSCLIKTIFLFDIIENKDENSCSKIQSVDTEECQNIINSIESENEEECQNDLCKDMLKLYLANLQKDVNSCEAITDKNIQNDCRLYLTSDISYCDYSYCNDIYNNHMREQTDDISYCENITNPTGKQSCLEYKKT
ncbi:MAG: hypothetical protein OEL89_02235 [Candidatus Peregrinibacteria bacterium]|nr:hypothetical protein [Candidatus Peregrinibacteria bacterium]